MQLRVKSDLQIEQAELDQETREGRTLASFAGAFFTAGDVITVSLQQGAALLAFYPDNFEAVEE
jgi:hypothetical protein